MQQNQVRSIVYTLQQNIRRVIVGKDEAIELALIALLCKGHVLIEDVPGVGKTTLAGRPGAVVVLLVQAHSVYARRNPQRHHRLYHALELQNRAKWNIKAAR